MAKRFSETDKWSDEWFSSLNPMQKLVFLFMVDKCDNAGFFEINSRLNSFMIGITEKDYLVAVKGLEKGFLWGKDGKKIWIKKFLLHQKNWPLNETNNAHKQILNIIELNQKNFEEHIINFSPLQAPNQGLISPIGRGKGKGIGIVNNIEEKIFEIFKQSSMLPDWQIKEEVMPRYMKYIEGKTITDHKALVNKFCSDVQPKKRESVLGGRKILGQ